MTTLDIVIPVFNEQATLENSVHRIIGHLRRTNFPWTWRITIVDNGSTDDTWRIANHLANEMGRVGALHLDRKGRGLALRTAWMASDADVVAYMDVDLSARLDALLPLVAPLVSRHSDFSIGTRHHRDARVTRSTHRKVVSWCYNRLLQVYLGVHFSDAMCGFKAARRVAVQPLLPYVVDNEWFFDAEVLYLAEREGHRIAETPLDWHDDPNSSVAIAATARKNLKGMWRVAHRGPADVAPRPTSPAIPRSAGRHLR